MRKGIFWIIAIIVAGMISLVFLNDLSQKTVEINYEGQPFVGDAAAPVNIIEFGDYKCPACKTFNDTIVPMIEQEFVATGKAKFYFINYSFINVDSHRSAQFAETVYSELGNDTFWEFHHLLLSKQPTDIALERADVFTEDFLEQTLAEIASAEDTAKVMKAFAENKGMEAWEKDQSLAKSLNVVSTPSLYINGKLFDGNSWDDLSRMIEKAAK